MYEFNVYIKGNGELVGVGGVYEWFDDVVIEYNEMKNSSFWNMSNFVILIDVVGGCWWILWGNFIYDYVKVGGNQISYAVFFKGNLWEGLIECNFVICELEHSG